MKNTNKILIILLLLIVIIISAAITSYSNRAVVYREVEIVKGQTLWNIAVKYNNNQDPRKLIYQMKKINDIENSILQPGQIIKVPVLN